MAVLRQPYGPLNDTCPCEACIRRRVRMVGDDLLKAIQRDQEKWLRDMLEADQRDCGLTTQEEAQMEGEAKRLDTLKKRNMKVAKHTGKILRDIEQDPDVLLRILDTLDDNLFNIWRRTKKGKVEECYMYYDVVDGKFDIEIAPKSDDCDD